MEDTILNILKERNAPMRPGDIAKALGVASKDISKVIAAMRTAGTIHSPKRCHYAPTKSY